ncbi:tRNA(Ile)-lysidine synthetase [Klebsiella pneumoniae]|uniref:tRNA(Ile)-lysidine synthetase n=1 Tax=Klebsiella pneumoniae TaxID=573 RepID=A0A2X3DER5_KLEPN|nr:tRNA(Ile)-lysidine synthetase [Klebsiella pneumoniae]
MIPVLRDVGRTLARPSPAAPACAPSRNNCWTRCWRGAGVAGGRRWLAGYRAAGVDESAGRAALLRRWLAGQQAPMPAREVPERLWHEVALAREDASPCLRLGEFTVRRFQQRLYWVKYLPVRRTAFSLARLAPAAAAGGRSRRADAAARRQAAPAVGG